MFARYLVIFFLAFVGVFSTNCGLSSFSAPSSASNADVPNANLILVEIAPSGKKPEVFLSAHDGVCRRGMPDEDEYGLDPLEEEEGGEAATTTTTTEAGTSSATENEQDIITTVNVSENWFSLGLNLANQSKNYFLVIEQLVFVVTGQWGSQQLLSGRKEISSGYCETDPLYIIPPNVRIRYEPSRKNWINNLTLFIDGVPIPTGPPIAQQAGGIGGTNNNQIGGAAQQGQGAGVGGVGGALGQQQNPIVNIAQNDEYVLTSLPSYRVQLILHGHFIDRSRKYIANFKKEIFFYTASQFLQ